jgi:Tripartite tricarboxylate transporter TctB family
MPRLSTFRIHGNPDAIVSLALVCFFGTWWVLALHFPPDARVLPSLVSGAGVVLSGIHFVTSGLSGRPVVPRVLDSTSSEEDLVRRRLAIGLIAPPVYTLITFLLGFEIAAIIALIGLPIILGSKKRLLLVIIAIMAIITIHFVFGKLLQVNLPIGIFDPIGLFRSSRL